MQVKTNIKKSRTLKDFTRLVLGFVCCLLALALFQQWSLFQGGVIEEPFNKAFWILLFNHIGFASLLSFLFLLIFRFLERTKAGTGFNACVVLFTAVLLFEGILVDYFSRNHSLLHWADLQSGFAMVLTGSILLKYALLMVGLGILYVASYRLSKLLNPFIGKMFPFTIILFLLFVGTSVVDKKPINQNKTLGFVTEAVFQAFDFNKYEGEEYPLVHDWSLDHTFAQYFNKSGKQPNFVFVVLDGLQSPFLKGGKYQGFTPFLDSISNESLYWNHLIANSTSKTDAVTNILGSLPQGKAGFTNETNSVNRNTLFGILKNNGYSTGFYYGGNTNLKQLNKFLNEEQTDIVLDKSRFNASYQLQKADRAGVTLGYPDKELYRKWGSIYYPSERPKAEFFLNLSTSKPFAVPNEDEYATYISGFLENTTLKGKERRFVKKNRTLFTAMRYADEALENLVRMYSLTKDYNNTVFIITGSGNAHLPNENPLKQQTVPLMIFGKPIKEAAQFHQIASHHDIAPSLVALLKSHHDIKLPAKSSWLGTGLTASNKSVFLSKANKGITAFIKDNAFLMGNDIYKIQGNLALTEGNSDTKKDLKELLKQAKAIERYVTTEDKLLPPTTVLYKADSDQFSKEELVWINSVFTGKNYDNAYITAKELAHEGNYKKALLLSSYVLQNAPGHIDAMILKGRIYGWQKRYNKAIATLEYAVDQHPFYHDGYAALLDVYYWSGNNIRATYILEKIKANDLETVVLIEKVERCMNQIQHIGIKGNQRLADIEYNHE